ncbi:DeoR/GlpR family DNA-binding transcription regulator [Brevibacillus brevis]|uniref:DeoR/GlpR family DNA-binding transcription regulator n=1 Tax=Brevibacillus brevis TaxID=1393 RepID=A0ABY9TD22_BREBE|nr:DeoR/GlpR family DNA-binding transcription regulator [Brevibacillus brevis]WNC17747.1 DeoR/GlpR family DNA-binding transcription regulator [Brevibacillus brevis]
MFQEERLAAILQYLQEHQRISVQDVVERFGVSRDTARRDIVKLEEQGQILRTRGGAILPTLTKKSYSYRERMQLGLPEKRSIAAVAAGLVKDGDYLMLDASTTVQLSIESLQTTGHVIITSSLAAASSLAGREGFQVKLLGGDVHPEDQYVYGSRAIDNLSDFHVDKLFIGACGITPSGLVSPTEESGYVIKEMMKRADQVIVLADQSKFGKSMLYRVAGLQQIDIIVTDQRPNPEMMEALLQHEVELLVAEDRQN